MRPAEEGGRGRLPGISTPCSGRARRIGSPTAACWRRSCGDWGRHAQNLVEAGLNLKAVEFHYPFTKIEELACLAGETVFVPYIMLDRQTAFQSVTQYYRHLLDTTGPSYRYWFACAGDSPELLAFARELEAA